MAGFQQYGYMQPPPTSQPPMPASRSTPPPPTGRASSYPDISYDTSSMDPLMVRSRIFIGNLHNYAFTREDLIELCLGYGVLVGATIFKGYAFIQFGRHQDADAAVLGLHNSMHKGTRLDVRVATNPKGVEKANEQVLKKRKQDDEELSKDIEHLNERNKKMIRIDHTKNSYLANTSMVDTLICGGCRFVTCDFEAYKNHRLGQCTKPKADKEPAVLKCASCEQILDSAWALIEHLTDFHRMRLYQLVEEQQPETAQQEMNTPTREEPIDSPGQ